LSAGADKGFFFSRFPQLLNVRAAAKSTGCGKREPIDGKRIASGTDNVSHKDYYVN
jgi:hypothetical protein